MNIFAQARKKIGLTQVEVSKRLNIEQSTISKWETGRSIPDQKILAPLADLYHVTTDYLLGREEEFTGLNIIERPLDPPKTEIQIAYDAMNERQRNKLLDYARGMLASEDIDLDELLRHNLK